MSKFSALRLGHGSPYLPVSGADTASLAHRLWRAFTLDIDQEDFGGAWLDMQDLAAFAYLEIQRAKDKIPFQDDRWPDAVILSDWLLTTEGPDFGRLPNLYVVPDDDGLWARILSAYGLFRLDCALVKMKTGATFDVLNDLATAANIACDLERAKGMDLQRSITQQAVLKRAKIGAEKRWAGDATQIAKDNVLECWHMWQADPARYRSTAAFSRDMLDKFDALKSQPVIERWCREWAKRSE